MASRLATRGARRPRALATAGLSPFRQSCRHAHTHHHIAVVGSGPAGFYTAKYLTNKQPAVKVDIIERLPVPYGLVRFGVAPDHGDTKLVMSTFEEVAASPNVRYCGNVEVGADVSVTDLLQSYSAVVLASGASSDRELGVPGEQSAGVISARRFVNWYNGHPDYVSVGQEFDLSKVTDVVVVGQGNVALDCARILCKPPAELASTDIATHALQELRRSAVSRVSMVGRRGHVQAAFTIKELREATRLDGCVFAVDAEELEFGKTAASEEERKPRPKKRIVELIEAQTTNPPAGPDEKQLAARFLLLPKAVETDEAGAAAAVVCERARLVGEVPGSQQAEGTGAEVVLPAQLVITSVGYKCEPLPGIVLDQRTSTLPHEAGRVALSSLDNDGNAKFAQPLGGLYVSGWLKRGPTGIIGSNIPDARETAAAVLADIHAGELQPADPAAIDGLYSGLDTVCWEAFQRIDAAESERGVGSDPPRPREKFVTVGEQLTAGREELHDR